MKAARNRLFLASLFVALAACANGCKLSSATQNVQGVQDFNAGRYNKAAERFHYSSLENPSNPDSLYNLASTLHHKAFLLSQEGRSQEAEDEVRDLQIQAEAKYNECLDRCEAIGREHVEAHRGLAVLLVEMGRSKQAFTLLEGWARRRPDLADPQTELARLYEEHGDDETALLHLGRAINTGDDLNSRSHARAFAAAGLIRERNGELAQAEQNYQQAFSLNRDQPGLGQHLAGLSRRRQSDTNQSTEGDTRLVRSRENRRY